VPPTGELVIADRAGARYIAGMVYTIGHSNHALERFVELICTAELAAVVDVRSAPVSSHAPQFNKIVLQVELPKHGLIYRFRGDELGGRPDGREFYDETGCVLYGKLSRSFAFQQGIEWLIAESEKLKLAVMCSEENPAICHRHLLISRVLAARGIRVTHLRGDGSSITYEQLQETIRAANPKMDQGELFGISDEVSWKSIQSVLPANQPNRFLDY
jgi:uncharacterized protein (DUF488 family)